VEAPRGAAAAAAAAAKEPHMTRTVEAIHTTTTRVKAMAITTSTIAPSVLRYEFSAFLRACILLIIY